VVVEVVVEMVVVVMMVVSSNLEVGVTDVRMKGNQ
jgi:hypothetical protein